MAVNVSPKYDFHMQRASNILMDIFTKLRSFIVGHRFKDLSLSRQKLGLRRKAVGSSPEVTNLTNYQSMFPGVRKSSPSPSVHCLNSSVWFSLNSLFELVVSKGNFDQKGYSEIDWRTLLVDAGCPMEGSYFMLRNCASVSI